MNAFSSMLLTLPGIETLVSRVQDANAYCPMLLRPLESVRFVRLVQFSNAPRLIPDPMAPFPMLVTLPGIVRLVRLVHKANAPTPMLLTPFEIVRVARL